MTSRAMQMRVTGILATFAVRFLTLACLQAMQPGHAMQPGTVSGPYEELVPQRLLGLVHTPEVHEQLMLTDAQVSDLETLFSEIDGPWFQSRILPPDKQRPIVGQLEQRIHQWFVRNTSVDQQQRLRQLELQAQSVRMLLRNDVGRQLRLDASQRARCAELARKTHEAERRLGMANVRSQATEQLSAAVLETAKAEKESLNHILRSNQHQQLWELLGKPFDTSAVSRIYPMAPEFVAVKEWVNSAPLTLKALRGKVVLVHFYAFQCHNCQANFDIYRRWHSQLRDKDVVVVGIQTPETSRERDPSAVRAAAAERDLRFPIMIDLESENWRAWGNTVWPTVYVVDKNGYIRRWWQGELNWKGADGDQTIEGVIDAALAE